MDRIRLQTQCWCSRLSLLSLFWIAVCLLLQIAYFVHYFFYITVIVILTVWLTCSLINGLFRQNQPLNLVYDDYFVVNISKELLEYFYGHTELYRFFFGKSSEKDQQNNSTTTNTTAVTTSKSHLEKKRLENIRRKKKIKSFDPLLNRVDGRVKLITQLISQKFISKWYTPLISQDTIFLDEANLLLESIFKRFFLIIPFIDTDKLTVECLAVVLRHLKEFRRAKKRALKMNNLEEISKIYRFAHPEVNTNKENNLRVHTHKITVHVLREFISWEIWNSYPCNLLVGILSNKLTYNLLKNISDPEWLLANLWSLLQTNDETTARSTEELQDSFNDTSSKDPLLNNKDSSKTNNELDVPSRNTDEKSAPQTPVIVHHEHPAEVIYIPNNENLLSSTVNSKTLDNPSNDSFTIIPNPPLIIDNVENVDWSHFSLNKKPTSIIPNECTVSYKSVEPNVKVYQPSEVTMVNSSNSGNNWMGDEFDFITMGQDLLAQTSEINLLGKRLWNFTNDPSDSDTGSNSSRKVDLEPPSEENGSSQPSTIQQSCTNTINRELKELQKSATAVQHTVTDAMHKIGDLHDEAAGYVEGILDFGIAGLRKGLRLTGLQDNAMNLPNQSHQPNRVLKSSPRVQSNEQFEDVIPTTQLSEPLIVEPSTTPVHHEGSFDDESPIYDEPSDLASSVAKLKSMLQQKTTGDSNLNTPAISPMVPLGEERVPVASEAGLSNLMVDPGIQVATGKNLTDNFLARTVTGVFNTLRTALPGNVADIPGGTFTANAGTIALEMHPMNQRWIFIEDDAHDTDLSKLLDTLLTERRDYCNIDAAYEAVDNMDLFSFNKTKQETLNIPTYDDDFDECFSNIPISHLSMDIVCELLYDTENVLIQDPVVRATLLIFGNLMENQISAFIKSTITKPDSVDCILKNISTKTPISKSDAEIVELLQNLIPSYIRNSIGASDLNAALSFLFESIKIQSINEDVCLQLLEIISSSIVQSNAEISPKSPYKC